MINNKNAEMNRAGNLGRPASNLQETCETEKFPLIHSFHKKGGKQDVNNVNNYRGASLLLTTYKILSKTRLNVMEEILDREESGLVLKGPLRRRAKLKFEINNSPQNVGKLLWRLS